MAMNGYTKLFNSIVASTIWSEPDETRIIWITMLAMVDQGGVVETSIPGLSVLARIPMEKCQEAIRTLESPDAYSRSQEHEGRRIQKVDGGWLILNHAKYRAKLNADERRQYKTVKQREYRSKPVDKSGLSYPEWTHTDTEADTEAEAGKSTSIPATDQRLNVQSVKDQIEARRGSHDEYETSGQRRLRRNKEAADSVV